jgi:hypothetical protein
LTIVLICKLFSDGGFPSGDAFSFDSCNQGSGIYYLFISSVADPDPPVFGPPGSGSTSQRYGFGSVSFYHHAKIVRKTLMPSIFDFLSLKNDVNVPSKSNKQKKLC